VVSPTSLWRYVESMEVVEDVLHGSILRLTVSMPTLPEASVTVSLLSLPHTGASDSMDSFEDVDPDCALDNFSVVPPSIISGTAAAARITVPIPTFTAAATPTVRLVIDICIHPTYQIPAPYMRAAEMTTGSLLDIEKMLKPYVPPPYLDPNMSPLESIKGSLFVTEEHPWTGKPYTTLHLCGVRENLEEFMSAPKSFLVEASFSLTEELSKLYLLNWFTLVGPSFGFPISASFYTLAKDALLAS
jgi:hypothetical protein